MYCVHPEWVKQKESGTSCELRKTQNMGRGKWFLPNQMTKAPFGWNQPKQGLYDRLWIPECKDNVFSTNLLSLKPNMVHQDNVGCNDGTSFGNLEQSVAFAGLPRFMPHKYTSSADGAMMHSPLMVISFVFPRKATRCSTTSLTHATMISA